MAFIGPSGCGKTTFLRCLNRMNDTIPSAQVTARTIIDGEDINDPKVDVVQLRARVGMVFQKPNPFPKTIFENVAYGPRIHGLATQRRRISRKSLTQSLRRAGLFEEVKDRLQRAGNQPVRRSAAAPLHCPRDRRRAGDHSDGRALLRPRSHRHRKDRGADRGTRENFTIIIVTHSMQQAARVSQRTAFFHLGNLVEEGPTERDLQRPERPSHPGLHHGPDRIAQQRKRRENTP